MTTRCHQLTQTHQDLRMLVFSFVKNGKLCVNQKSLLTCNSYTFCYLYVYLSSSVVINGVTNQLNCKQMNAMECQTACCLGFKSPLGWDFICVRVVQLIIKIVTAYFNGRILLSRSLVGQCTGNAVILLAIHMFLNDTPQRTVKGSFN